MSLSETRSLLRLLLLFTAISTMLDVFAAAEHVHIERKYYSYQDPRPRISKALEHVECEDGKPKSENFFTWADYLVLVTMLVVSCGVGVFYGFFGQKQETASDFLLGGSSMGTFPMAMSLAASFITAIELLGNPAEMYMYGSQYWAICIAFLLVMRFNATTRYIASGLYILQMILYTSVAVYAPALALSHETGLNVYLAVTAVYVVCIFYASQGGMKAVIMTDIFQACVLIGSILLIVFLGEKFVGGAGIIWSQNYNTDRLELFNMDPNPTVRHSFWSVVIGGTFYWLTMFCSNQASIQKYMSVENISQVRKALWTSSFGLILIFTVNFYSGMILVANYRDCDPIKSGQISSSDEILPLYVVSEMGHLKGVTGFFIAGIFAASLGTVASALNSLTAVTQQDFISGALGVKLKESRGAFWGKCISVGYGLLSFALVFVVEQLGNIMTIALTFNGMVGGVTLGLFTLGMFFPWANAKGAIFGSMVSLALVMWIGLGQQVAKINGSYVIESKELSVEFCPCYNSTTNENTSDNSTGEDLFPIYRISYLWYSVIGVFTTILVGLTTSFFTGPQDPQTIDEDLLSPPIKRLYSSLPERWRTFLNLHLLSEEKPENTKKVASNGIDNATLDIRDELFMKSKEKENDFSVKIKRKISAP